MDPMKKNFKDSQKPNSSIHPYPKKSPSLSLDLQSFLDQCTYSPQSLSCFNNNDLLKPIILTSPSTPLSISTYSPILRNSSQTLKNICDYKIQYEDLITKSILVYEEPQCSDCKKLGIYNLKCGHFNCSSCIYNKSHCSLCKRPKSFYDLELEYYICLKCKKFKKHQGKLCRHYCTECIFSTIRVKKSLACDICPIVYKNTDIFNCSVKCNSCEKTGLRFEDWFIEICDEHMACYSCVQKSIEYFGCMVCEKKLTMKEVYNLKKKMKIFCEVCMKLKKVKEAQQKECCDSIQCKYCYSKYKCLNCES